MLLEKVNQIIQRKRSLLCVGLDIDIERIPTFLHKEVDPLFLFNREIVEATRDYVAAYKLNIAFYEVLGVPGWELLERTLAILPRDVLLIADAKRGDVGHSSRKYAETYFQTYPFDAVTVSPYLGHDSLEPFLEYEGKGVFVLALTSNPGSIDFQYLKVDHMPLYLKVAEKVMAWNFIYGNCGLVVGGTHANEIAEIRQLVPELPFLVPGIGAQGGNLEVAVRYATDEQGRAALFNVSRSILYASDQTHFAEVAREKARQLRDQINLLLSIYKNLNFMDEN